MAVEKNLQVQLGESWTLAFTSDVDLALEDLTLILANGDSEAGYVSGAESPTTFALDSPPLSGTVTVEPFHQSAVQPGALNYEIRSVALGGETRVLQFGLIAVGASLFAWPAAST